MKLWKVVKDNDLDTLKVGDIETQITELQKGIKTGSVIGFFYER